MFFKYLLSSIQGSLCESWIGGKDQCPEAVSLTFMVNVELWSSITNIFNSDKYLISKDRCVDIIGWSNNVNIIDYT